MADAAGFAVDAVGVVAAQAADDSASKFDTPMAVDVSSAGFAVALRHTNAQRHGERHVSANRTQTHTRATRIACCEMGFARCFVFACVSVHACQQTMRARNIVV